MKINHFSASVIIWILAALLLFISLIFGIDALKDVAEIFFKKATVLIFGMAFLKYYKTKDYDVDKTLTENPVALSIFLAGMFIGIGFAWF